MTTPFEAGGMLRDDALLDALGRGELPDEARDDSTARLLFGWRADLVTAMPASSEPPTVEMPLWFGPGAGFEVAEHGLNGSRALNGSSALNGSNRLNGGAPRGPRSRRLRRKNIVLAVAVTVVGIGSAGGVAAAGTAQPGDPLWPLVRVVYAERAESLEAREDARLALSEARRAAGAHESQRAQEYLQIALKRTDKVRSKDGRAELNAEARRLQEEIAEIDDDPSPEPSTRRPEQRPAEQQPSPTPPLSPVPEPSPTPEPSPSEPPSEPPPSSDPPPAPETSPQGSGDVAPAGVATGARLPVGVLRPDDLPPGSAHAQGLTGR